MKHFELHKILKGIQSHLKNNNDKCHIIVTAKSGRTFGFPFEAHFQTSNDFRKFIENHCGLKLEQISAIHRKYEPIQKKGLPSEARKGQKCE